MKVVRLRWRRARRLVRVTAEVARGILEVTQGIAGVPNQVGEVVVVVVAQEVVGILAVKTEEAACSVLSRHS
jgi:hypothetical protein